MADEATSVKTPPSPFGLPSYPSPAPPTHPANPQNDAVLLSSCEDDVQSGGSSPAPAGPGMVLTTPQRSRLGAKASRIPTR